MIRTYRHHYQSFTPTLGLFAILCNHFSKKKTTGVFIKLFPPNTKWTRRLLVQQLCNGHTPLVRSTPRTCNGYRRCLKIYKYIYIFTCTRPTTMTLVSRTFATVIKGVPRKADDFCKRNKSVKIKIRLELFVLLRPKYVPIFESVSVTTKSNESSFNRSANGRQK